MLSELTCFLRFYDFWQVKRSIYKDFLERLNNENMSNTTNLITPPPVLAHSNLYSYW